MVEVHESYNEGRVQGCTLCSTDCSCDVWFINQFHQVLSGLEVKWIDLMRPKGGKYPAYQRRWIGR